MRNQEDVGVQAGLGLAEGVELTSLLHVSGDHHRQRGGAHP